MLAGLAAGAAFVAVLWPAGATDVRTRRLLWTAWWALFVGTLLGLGLQAADIAERIQGGIPDEEFGDADEIITAKGLDQLKTVMPQIDVAELKGKVSQLPTTWTLLTGGTGLILATFGFAFALVRFGLPR